MASLLTIACAPSANSGLDLESDVLSLATGTKKLPANIEEKKSADVVAAYYKNVGTRRNVVSFFAGLTESERVALAILDKSTSHKVPISLAFALAYEESRFNPNASSTNSGSVDRGLFQLNSATFPDLEAKAAFDPIRNADEGMRYFRHILDISGNEISALAMYNAGRTRVSQKGAPVTTLAYISRILTYERNIESLFAAKVVARPSVIDRIKLGMLTQDRGRKD
jgi:soluble lytic murein transglycosylase-like protein